MDRKDQSNGDGFTTSHLNNGLFQNIVKGICKDASLMSWSVLEMKANHAISSAVAVRGDQYSTNRLVGLSFYKVKYINSKSKEPDSKIVVLKSKTGGNDLVNSWKKLMPDSKYATMMGTLAILHPKQITTTHYRELECVSLKDEYLRSVMPEIYWSWIDYEQDIFVYAMEYLDPLTFSHIDEANNIDAWTNQDILDVLKGLSILHGRFYNDFSKLSPNLRKYTNELTLMKILPTLKDYVNQHKNKYPHFWNKEVCNIFEVLFDNTQFIAKHVESATKTFLHGDTFTLNISLRRESSLPKKHRLCLYDWEYCMVGLPQQDIALFLACTIPMKSNISTWHHYVETYMNYLQEEIHNIEVLNLDDFMIKFDMSMCESLINCGNWAYVPLNDLFPNKFSVWYYDNMIEYATYVINKYKFKRVSDK